MRTIERLAFDVGIETNPQRVAHNFASYTIEHADLPIWRRINTEYLFLRSDGSVVDVSGIPIDQQLRKETESDFLENPVVPKIITFLHRGRVGDVLWWGSPKSGKFRYTESRSIFYELFEEQGQRYLILHAVPGPHVVQDYLRVARDLSEYRRGWDVPVTEDELRGTPIWVCPPKSNHWVRIFEQYLDFPPQVWKVIENGEDIKGKEEILKHALEVNRKWRKVVSQARTPYERVWVGAQMEEDMARRVGFGVQAFGSCGISNTEALRRGIFDRMFGEREYPWSGNCPLCGTYNKNMRRGDRCSGCDQVYEGCGRKENDALLVRCLIGSDSN
ncbi:MAG: hypothetical protein HYU80_00775 [Candidatus Blackburnbacteria bacterium]|nr:hypothetical protein [Candidatus Blackburnbacteria bacterium]